MIQALFSLIIALTTAKIAKYLLDRWNFLLCLGRQASPFYPITFGLCVAICILSSAKALFLLVSYVAMS